MSEFSGKEYYGYALRNHPELSTTTRNFEFKYNRPELLDRVIEKVQLADVAGQMNAEKSSHSSVTRKTRPEGGKFSSDIDVETQMSCSNGGQTRLLSEDEVERLIYKARSCAALKNNSSKSLCPGCCGALKNTSSKTLCSESEGAWLPCHEDEFIEKDYQKKNSSQQEAVLEEFCAPKPQWVEVIETPAKGSLSQMHAVQLSNKNVINTETKLIQMEDSIFYRNSVEITGLMPMQANVPSADCASEQTYIDSDLEYEMMQRGDYIKYCEPRPRLDDMLASTESSDESPIFIEVEKTPAEEPILSFLKNKSPMRYSYSDRTSEREKDEQDPGDGVYKVHVTSEKAHTVDVDEKPPKHKQLPNAKAKSKKSSKLPAKRKPAKSMSAPVSPKKQQLSPDDSARPMVPKQNTVPNTVRNATAPNTCRSKRTTQLRATPKRKKLILSRSMEALKHEKLHLFNKMHKTHEKIITALDLMRNGLMLLCVPRAKNEKARTLQNAMSFSVRFSRNYLYPIQGIVVDLKKLSIEAFNSASTNEACQRVATVYTLIWQALLNFQKQLRYFLVEHVPQKLTALIETMLKVTQICLEKTVFARNDPLVECLVDRCTKFLGFVETIQTERLQAARDQNRKTELKKGHKDYDLKMYMNDLNMYEPQLVPRNIPKRRTIAAPKRKPKANRHNAAAVNSADFLRTNNAEDAISTQVQGLDSVASVEFSVQSLFNDSLNDNDDDEEHSGVTEALNKSIIEALQKVTKEQVRQVLEPILRALGSAIHEKQNSKTIEAILQAFHSNRLEPGTQQQGLCDPTNNKGKVSSEKSIRVTSSTTAQQSATSESLSTASKTESLPQRKSYEAAVNCYSDDDDNRSSGSGCGDHISQRRASSDTSIDDNIRRYQHMERMLAGSDECTGGAVKSAVNAVIKSHRQQKQTLKKHGEHQQAQLMLELQQLQQLEDEFEAEILPGPQKETLNKNQKQRISLKQSSADRRAPGTAPRELRSQEARKLPPKSASRAVRKEAIPTTTRLPHVCPKPNAPRQQNFRKKKRNVLASPPPVPTVTPNRSTHTGSDSDEAPRSNCSFRLDECTLVDSGHINYAKTPIPLTNACQFQSPRPMPQNFAIGLGHFNSDGSVPRKTSRTKVGNEREVVDSKSSPVHLPTSNSSYQPVSEPERLHLNQLGQNPKADEIEDQVYQMGSAEESTYSRELQRKIDKQKAAEQELLQLKEEMYTQELHELETLQMQLALKKEEQKLRERRTELNVAKDKEDFSNNVGDSNKSQNKQTDSDDALGVCELIRERDRFVDLCQTNRFYSNPNFKDPWKIFSRISNYVVNEMVDAVEQDFSLGVTTFVKDFIQMETETGNMDFP